MILGGELTSKQITFSVGSPTEAFNVQTTFAARSSHFLIPPYNERVDMKTENSLVHFFRHDGAELFYEDAKFILNKTLLFQLITPDKANVLLDLAKELLPLSSTLLFPDSKRTLVECTVYENWARFDFHARQFTDVAEQIRTDVANYFPPNIKVTANSTQEIIFRTEGGERLLLSHPMLKKLAAVLVSYGLLPPELHHRFILNAEQFSLMQGARIYLYHTLHNIKDAETVGGQVYATYASDQALRVLKQLAEHGDMGMLQESDAVFLSHIQLFNQKEYRAFDGVYGLRKFMEQFIVAYGSEIRALHDLRLREQREMRRDGQEVGYDETDIIEGSTSKTIERNDEFQRLAEHYQKRLGQ